MVFFGGLKFSFSCRVLQLGSEISYVHVHVVIVRCALV